LQVDPVPWFLYGKDDVRSAYYLEDAATEYRVQGLEVNWVCVTRDADFRRIPSGWEHWKFVGTEDGGVAHHVRDDMTRYKKNDDVGVTSNARKQDYHVRFCRSEYPSGESTMSYN
jgi:hypothetical protein